MVRSGKTCILLMVCLCISIATLYGYSSGADLHEVAANGDLAAVKRLIEQGADVNARNEDGWTPLHTAAFMGHRDVVELLRRHGGHE